MDDFIIVYMTTEKEDHAKEISRQLVSDRLVACAQIVGPIRSIYRWKGKVEDEREWLCIFKTRRSLFERLSAKIKELHSYEVPEIVGVPIKHGSTEYLDWLDCELLK